MAENEDVTGRPADDATPAQPPGAEGTERGGAPQDGAAQDGTTDAPAQAASQPVLPSAGPQPVLKSRWRDRAWSFRAMIAVAAASLVIGGIAGGVAVALADDDDDANYRMGPWGPGQHPMPPGWRERGPGELDRDGGPGWRWNDGPQQDPTQPTPSPSPGSTG